MSTIAPDAEKLREIDEDTRRAWAAYSASVRELTGDEYDSAEDASWNELQQELNRLEERRRSLTGTAS